jgi:hypothetical protein
MYIHDEQAGHLPRMPAYLSFTWWTFAHSGLGQWTSIGMADFQEK